MTVSALGRALAPLVLLTLALSPVEAKDRPYDRDWGTGVAVPPGATTWTSDNYEQKAALIRETAAAQARACSHYAFLGWPPGSGGTDVIMSATRKSYETAGWSIDQKPGHISTETVWIVAKDGREAVILWGAVMGSTIYLSCITAGEPAADPDKALYVGVPLALGVASLLGGLWLIWRKRSQGTTAVSMLGLGLAPAVAGAMLIALAVLLFFIL